MKAQFFAAETYRTGEFERQEDVFRDWVSSDGSHRYPARISPVAARFS
jgi:hypothetical protein